MAPRTLFEKVWDAHVVVPATADAPAVLYVDLHLVHEVTSPQAFDGLRLARPARAPARPHRRHGRPQRAHTRPRAPADRRPARRGAGRRARARTAASSASRSIDSAATAQGIVHVIGPELGLTQPGMTIVCGDSHTRTHGAFGALAFGIGTSEVEHVLATQMPAASARRRRWRSTRRRPSSRAGVDGQGPDPRHSSAASAPAARTGHVIEYTRRGRSARSRWKSA